MTSAVTDEILAAMFASLDAGAEPDGAALRLQFPGHDVTIETLLASVAQYGVRRGALAAELGELAPGTRLGDFVIEGPLRRGGMGVVYRARQTTLGDRLVALKVVHGGEGNPEQEQRFEREARLAAALHHEHLVPVHGVGRERGVFWCAMRLVEGPSLQDVLERLVRERKEGAPAHAASRRRLVQRIAEVAHALAAMHEAGLVHRDVKPANIVLDGPAAAGETVPSAPAVLVDFGLARVVDAAPLTHTLRASATPAYAPPEQLLGRHDVDARADVFALGVTLHDLLCARRPQDRLQASAGLEPLHELIPDVDADLASVVAVATDPLPEWRYADGAALHADLRAWLDGRPVTARRLMPHERGLRWARRHPRTVLRGVLLAAAAVTLLVAAVGVTERLRLAGDARDARERGRLVPLDTALTTLADLPLGMWFLAPADQALLPHLRATDDPLRRIVRLLASGAAEDGYLSVARELMRRRGRMDGLMRAALLDGLDFPPGARTPPPTLPAALVAVARCCYERPDRSSDDVADSAPLRDRLLALLRDGRVGRNERLNALFGLGGCGTPGLLVAADAHAAGPVANDFVAAAGAGGERSALARSADEACGPRRGPSVDLSSWILDQGQHSEERRIGMLGIEQVLRRAPNCGLRAQLTREQSDELGNRIDELLVGTMGGTWDECNAAEELARAWLFFRRARGEDIALPPEWCASAGPHTRLLLEAASGVRPAPFTLSDTFEMRSRTAEECWRIAGWACAVAPDQRAAVAAGLAALQPLRAARDAHALALGAFLAGALSGVDELSGRRPELDPDAESRLDYPCATCPDELPSRHAGESPDPLVLAEWDFMGPDLLLRGSACAPVTGLLVDPGDPLEPESPAVLRGFGTSTLLLPFILEEPLSAEVERAAGGAEPVVMLRHLAALRGYVPWGGRAQIGVTLDDVPLDGGMWVPGPSMRDDRVAVARSQLQPGAHVLRITLQSGTTTTYRLGKVTLSLRP